MATVTITIEDTNDGNVKITATPTFETMMMMNASGHEWTAAQGYALRMLNEARRVSKENNPTQILIPRIGR